MKRGQKHLVAAMRCAEDCTSIPGSGLYDAAISLEIAVIDGDEERLRDQLGVVIRKAMIVSGIRRVSVVQSLAQEAAIRNEHKGDWRKCLVATLIEKLYEEVDELYMAVKSGDRDHIRYELGDVIWTATMVVDKMLYLDLPQQQRAS